MTYHLDERLVSHEGFHIVDACAATAIIIGCIALLGWSMEIRFFTSLSPYESHPTMKVNTALGLIMLGMALSALQRGLHQLVVFGSCAALLLSAGALYEYGFHTDLGINNLFFDDTWSQAPPGRMSLASALGFGFGGLLLISHSYLSPRFPRIYDLLLLLFFLEPLFSLDAYITSAPNLLQSGLFQTYSIPTAFGFLCFSCGLIAATDTGLCALLRGNDLAAKQYRKTIIFITGSALVLGLASNLPLSLALDTELTMAIRNNLFLLALLFFVGQGYKSFRAETTLLTQQLHSIQSEHTLAEVEMLDILTAADDAILLVDEQRRIIRSNAGTTRIFGWPEDELFGEHIESLVPERFRVNDIGQFYDFLASDERSRNYDRRGKTLGLTKKGFEKSISVSLYKNKKLSDYEDVSHLQNTPQAAPCSPQQRVYVVAIIHELSGLESDIVDINSRASIDHLTGLPDHEQFLRFCSQFQAQEKRQEDEGLCLILVDMDSLKRINERYERDFGDQVLQTITSTLKHRLRTSDKLFRYLSDHFVLVASSKSPVEAELMAERIRTAVKVSPTRLNDKNIYTTCTLCVFSAQNQKIDLKKTVDYMVSFLQGQAEDNHDRVLIIQPSDLTTPVEAGIDPPTRQPND